MQDTEIRDLVIKHDHAIESLASSIERMADSATTTNKKLEDVVSALNSQNILAERMANMDSNNNQKFDVIFNTFRTYDTMHNTEGCPALRVLSEREKSKDKEFEDMVKIYDKRVKSIEDSITWLIRLFVGSIILGVLQLTFHISGVAH